MTDPKEPTGPKDPKTLCLEILLKCRCGLRLPGSHFMATHYTADGLVMMFRYLDEKLYRIEVREVRSDIPHNDPT